MKPLLEEIQHNKLLWLLDFVPVVFAAEQLQHEAHTLLFVLSVLAIVPLAALLSHATESVAAKTGDAAGGLLNATLGNLTELVIALTALRAGQYVLVKASMAGAIVTNTLFMLGASLFTRGCGPKDSRRPRTRRAVGGACAKPRRHSRFGGADPSRGSRHGSRALAHVQPDQHTERHRRCGRVRRSRPRRDPARSPAAGVRKGVWPDCSIRNRRQRRASAANAVAQ